MLTKSSGNLVLQPYEKGWNGAVTANKSTIPNAEVWISQHLIICVFI